MNTIATVLGSLILIIFVFFVFHKIRVDSEIDHVSCFIGSGARCSPNLNVSYHQLKEDIERSGYSPSILRKAINQYRSESGKYIESYSQLERSEYLRRMKLRKDAEVHQAKIMHVLDFYYAY